MGIWWVPDFEWFGDIPNLIIKYEKHNNFQYQVFLFKSSSYMDKNEKSTRAFYIKLCNAIEMNALISSNMGGSSFFMHHLHIFTGDTKSNTHESVFDNCESNNHSLNQHKDANITYYHKVFKQLWSNAASKSNDIWPNGIIFHQPGFSWNKGISLP